MEAEREWREAEMRLLKNHIALLPTEHSRRTARKALVVMLYAHFEGVSKALFTMYVNRLNTIGLRVNEVAAPLGAASLTAIFEALRNPNKKCAEFASSLPDDTALHRFARDREFIEVAWKVAERSVRLDPEQIIDTESNLKPVVLKKILYRLGFRPDLVKPWESAIHQLINRRNDIAHGTATAGLEEREYSRLEQAVSSVVDDIVREISAAVTKRTYLVQPPAGPEEPNVSTSSSPTPPPAP